MHILRGLGFKNPSVPLGFASKTHVNFGAVLEGGPGGPLEKRRSNDAGSAARAFDRAKPGPWPAAATRGRCPTSGVVHLAADPAAATGTAALAVFFSNYVPDLTMLDIFCTAVT